MRSMMTKALLLCLLTLTTISLSEPALAQAPDPAPEAETTSEPEQNLQRPSDETVAADTELGQTIAVELGKVLGVAISPAVGLAAVGLWYRATSEHPQNYWYASWWFIATMSSLSLLGHYEPMLL